MHVVHGRRGNGAYWQAVIDAVASSYASAKLALQAQLSAGLASVGTLTANGATPVTVTDANIKTTSIVMFGLNTVGGTVGAIPTVKTITAGTSFTVAGTASDTSIYNYAIINPVAN